MNQFVAVTGFFLVTLFVSSCVKEERIALIAPIDNKMLPPGSCDDLAEAPYHFISVQPSEVGTGIYSDFNASHLASTPTVASIGTLLVFLVGSNADPVSCSKFYKKANGMGYHVVAVSYVNSPNVPNPCSGVTASSLQDFCKEVFYGNTNTNSPMTEVDNNNCILTRLKNLLAWLNTNYSSGGWKHFFSLNTGNIYWNRIIIAGISQGGTHAAMIGSLENVKRVICFSSPREMCYGTNSTWPALSLTKYYSFCHASDGYFKQQAIWLSMGFSETPANVDTTNAPYNNAHLLTTSISTTQEHKCTAVNCNLPIDGWDAVWGYLLTL